MLQPATRMFQKSLEHELMVDDCNWEMSRKTDGRSEQWLLGPAVRFLVVRCNAGGLLWVGRTRMAETNKSKMDDSGVPPQWMRPTGGRKERRGTTGDAFFIPGSQQGQKNDLTKDGNGYRDQISPADDGGGVRRFGGGGGCGINARRRHALEDPGQVGIGDGRCENFKFCSFILNFF